MVVCNNLAHRDKKRLKPSAPLLRYSVVNLFHTCKGAIYRARSENAYSYIRNR